MGTVVALLWSAPLRTAVCRPLDGAAELAVRGSGSGAAVDLVDAVLEADPAIPGTATPGEAARLAVADRDRVLAALCEQRYGPRVETTVTCGECGRLFTLDFLLPELLRHCAPSGPQEGPWQVAGRAVRPPTGEDELAVLGCDDPEQALLSRVLAPAPPSGTDAEPDADVRALVAAELERRAPMVSAPVGAACAECGAEQAVRFDVQDYLLRRLLLDRRGLLGEVHLIAAAYHWSRASILALPTEERRTYAALLTEGTDVWAASR